MNRSTGILVVVLVVLGAVVFFLIPSGQERETSEKVPEISVSVDSASVVSVSLERPGKSVTIENVGGKWKITSPIQAPAEAAAVAQLVGALSKLRVGSLVSSNPQKQALYQVD